MAIDIKALAADALTMPASALARKYNRSERRIFQLMAMPAFIAEKESAAAAAYHDAMMKARALAFEAVTVLQDVMTDTTAAPGARAQAAAQLLSLSVAM